MSKKEKMVTNIRIGSAELGCLGMSTCILILNVFWFIVSIIGVIHAFGQSVVLGILSLLGFGSLTPLIEFVDWFSTKQLWVEINTFLGL